MTFPIPPPSVLEGYIRETDLARQLNRSVHTLQRLPDSVALAKSWPSSLFFKRFAHANRGLAHSTHPGVTCPRFFRCEAQRSYSSPYSRAAATQMAKSRGDRDYFWWVHKLHREGQAGKPYTMPGTRQHHQGGYQGILRKERSERNLKRHLSDPGIAGGGNLAKLAPNVTVGVRELHVIERIEKFRTKLQSRPFTDPGELVQGKVPIVKSGAVKETPIRVSRDAEIFTGEWGRIEVLVPRLSWVKVADLLAVVFGHIGAATPAKGLIVALRNRDREPRGEARNP